MYRTKRIIKKLLQNKFHDLEEEENKASDQSCNIMEEDMGEQVVNNIDHAQKIVNYFEPGTRLGTVKCQGDKNTDSARIK